MLIDRLAKHGISKSRTMHPFSTRTAKGDCPLGMEAEACPMWQFVNADLPTDLRADPFRELSQLKT